jgi:CoA:oxalate CoA-transferase
VIVAAGNDVLWGKLCRILGREELIGDPRFANNHLRTENQPELSTILTSELIKKTTGEWIEIFEKQDIPYSRINNIKEICEDPIIRHRQMLVSVDQPEIGPVRIASSPIRLSETPGRVESPAPLLGEHSEEVLRTVLGYGRERIEALRTQGVINKTV